MGIDVSLPKLGRQPISLQIMDLLTNLLLSGELKPGDRLPTELELAQKLGVGRNSVREAIKMLSSIGVVDVQKGAGTFVAKSMNSTILNPLILSLVFEQGTSKELIELRLLLEIGSAELALANITDEFLERLEQMNMRLKEEGEQEERNPKRLLDIDLGFHMELHRISGNKLLIKLVESIYTLFFASIEKTLEQAPRRAYENHQIVIDALRKRDIEAIRSGVRRSMEYWMSNVQETPAKK